MTSPANQQGLRVVELRAENVKRLTAVQVRPDGSLVTVSGPNGAGKSSLLDAIMYALGGKSTQPSRPVRDGAEEAEVEVDLGRYRVRRVIRPGRQDLLEVRAADGARFSSPQSLLDGLVGDLTFDPLEFSRRRPAEQAEVLRKLAGIDTTDVDAQEREAFDRRAASARQLRDLEAQLAGLPHDPDAPRDQQDATALRSRMVAAMRAVEQLGAMTRRRLQLADKVAQLAREIEAARGAQAELEQQLVAAKQAASAAGNPDEIAATLKDLDARNQRARAAQERRRIVEAAEAAHTATDAAHTAVQAARAERARRIEAASMPLPGLSLGDGEILVAGIPLSQASQGERLRVAAAIGMALNPTIRVLLIRDGSLLDRAGLADLARIAQERGFQVWCERVAEPGQGVGIVIEDGHVAETQEVPW